MILFASKYTSCTDINYYWCSKSKKLQVGSAGVTLLCTQTNTFQLGVAALQTAKQDVYRGAQQGLGGAEEVEAALDTPPCHQLTSCHKALTVHTVIQKYTRGEGGEREGKGRVFKRR